MMSPIETKANPGRRETPPVRTLVVDDVSDDVAFLVNVRTYRCRCCGAPFRTTLGTHVCDHCESDPVPEFRDPFSEFSAGFLEWLKRSPSFHSVEKAWPDWQSEDYPVLTG